MLPTDTPHSFPPMYLISESRLGRRGLLLSSSSSMALSSLALGLGILYAVPWLSAVALVAVVAGFSIGLGPVPFLILPELVEPRVRPVRHVCRSLLTSSLPGGQRCGVARHLAELGGQPGHRVALPAAAQLVRAPRRRQRRQRFLRLCHHQRRHDDVRGAPVSLCTAVAKARVMLLKPGYAVRI